jgi:hypothetical protein
LDYVISGEGKILIADDKNKNILMNEIFKMSDKGITRNFMNLVNDFTYWFIWSEFRKYTSNDDNINNLINVIIKFSENGITRNSPFGNESMYEYVWCEYRNFKVTREIYFNV